MNITDHAYSTEDPTIVGAYRQGLADRATFTARLKADVEALGAGPRVFMTGGAFGGRDEFTGLEQAGDVIPDGWRIVKDRLVPRRGKPGEGARKWLAEHQPVDVRHTLSQHGLPRSTWIPSSSGSFSFRIVSPELFEQDGTLWACYQGEPGTSDSGFDDQKCTWTQRKLSEFYAAKEAFEAAQSAETVTVAGGVL